MAQPKIILAFENVTVEASDEFDVPIRDVSFSLKAGELMLVRLESGRHRNPLADAAGGMVEANAGAVKFCEVSWQDMSPGKQAKCREELAGCLMGLRGSAISISTKTSRWPSGIIPADRSRISRRKCKSWPFVSAWRKFRARVRIPYARVICAVPPAVRAFLGKPELIILERPTHLHREVAAPLFDSIIAARSEGSAILWTTEDSLIWNHPELKPSARFVLKGESLESVAIE